MRSSTILLALTLGWTSSQSVAAQKILWDKSLGGKQSDYLMDALPTPDYGFLLAGSSLSIKSGNKQQTTQGDLDFWLWKMDEKGDQEWQKNFGGSGSDLLYSITASPDGGYLIAGTSNSPKSFDKKTASLGGDDIWLIKLNPRGEEEWQLTLGGMDQEKIAQVIPTRNGGFLVAGSSASEPRQDRSPMDPKAPSRLKSGALYGDLDYWVIQLNSKGEVEWQQTYGGQYVDELRSVAATADGGFILGGYSNSPVSGTKTERNRGIGDYWVIRIDEKGTVLWQRTLGGDQDDQLYSVLVTHDQNILLGGNSNSGSSDEKTSSNQEGTDFWLVKLDTAGNLLWQQTYNFGKTDVLTTLVENKDHSLLLGGFAQGEYSLLSKGKGKLGLGKGEPKAKKGTDDFIALKVNEKGEEIWSRTVGSNGKEVLRKVVETRDGGYLMAGTSFSKATGDKTSSVGRNDFWVVKLKDEQKPDTPKLTIEASPNPTYGFTTVVIGYEFESGTATVVDLSGRVLQQFAINSRTVPVDLSSLPEGIYVVNIKTDKQSDGVKIIKRTTKTN
ncbi:T9SS type A sorting domain-containing protein [Flavobacterium stagni]|uniref:T9SS type A sorting domain-containing protein n=1 Tax=Flavobacterium stagni TaxID=2506421 RepID=A0A4Q1K6Z6_9FLAO|nr:T9SS type A sorting domain-containing protein [Flavobacterium stagni]RXR21459.1 T9SS type A sorting domain-containing protein [Flavobacterium stagni]